MPWSRFPGLKNKIKWFVWNWATTTRREVLDEPGAGELWCPGSLTDHPACPLPSDRHLLMESARMRGFSHLRVLLSRFHTIVSWLFFSYLFIRLCQVLAAARGIFSCCVRTLSCSMWGLVPWPGIKSRPPAQGVQSLSHWTPREVPLSVDFDGQQLVKKSPRLAVLIHTTCTPCTSPVCLLSSPGPHDADLWWSSCHYPRRGPCLRGKKSTSPEKRQNPKISARKENMGGQKQIWLLGPQSLRTRRRSEDSQSTGVKKGFRVTEEVQELDQLSSTEGPRGEHVTAVTLPVTHGWVCFLVPRATLRTPHTHPKMSIPSKLL